LQGLKFGLEFWITGHDIQGQEVEVSIIYLYGLLGRLNEERSEKVPSTMLDSTRVIVFVFNILRQIVMYLCFPFIGDIKFRLERFAKSEFIS